MIKKNKTIIFSSNKTKVCVCGNPSSTIKCHYTVRLLTQSPQFESVWEPFYGSLSLCSHFLFLKLVWSGYLIAYNSVNLQHLSLRAAKGEERIREECVLDPISILGGFNGAFVQFILDLLTIKMTNYWGRSCDSCVVNEK